MNTKVQSLICLCMLAGTALAQSIFPDSSSGSLTNVLAAQVPAVLVLAEPSVPPHCRQHGYTLGGQLASEDGPWANDTLTNAYSNRRRVSSSLQQPGTSGWTNGFAYDAAARLYTLSSPAGIFQYGYDSKAKLRVGQIALPNAAFITNSYDRVARPRGTSLLNSGNSILDAYTFTYDLAGRRTHLDRGVDGSYVDYTYDNIGQLATASGKENGGLTNRLHEQFGYAYDPAGNLNWRTNNALLQQFQVNSLNELNNLTRTAGSTLTVAGVTSGAATNVLVNGAAAVRYADRTFAKDGFTIADGNNNFTAVAQSASGLSATNSITVYLPLTNTFTYDSNGNLTADGLRSFAYDDDDQLVTNWVAGAWKSEFVYDGQHRRRIERDYGWSGSSWALTNETHFIYDGAVVLQERDANNTRRVTYTRGLDLSGTFQGAGGIGGLLARSEPLAPVGQIAYYHCDGNGNITCLANTNQLILAKYLYGPFGTIVSQSGPLADANAYRFSSKEYGLNSGLVYYGRRFYAPEIQHWLNRDPIGEQGGINLYAYVGNDPVNKLDPLGLDCCKQKYSDCLAKCIEKERFDLGAVLGTAASALGFGTMPKTPAELRSLGQTREAINPYTGQVSRWAGRFGGRPGGFGWLRNFGRSIGGRALGGLATGALVFEGFYDIGAIARCSFVCAKDHCAY